MAPKKKEATQKMSLGAFLQDDAYGGSWADEVEDSFGSQPLPSSGRPSGYGGGGGYSTERSYPSRDSFPQELPTKPPYTAHLGNLSYDATNETIEEFFDGCGLTSVRIVEDKFEQRPKGFGYAEFNDVEGLKKALELDGQSFQGRGIRIKIADPPKDRDRPDRGFSARDLSSWDRTGPLPDIPRSNDRRDFSDRPARGPPRDGPGEEARPPRDLDWGARKGPLSPLPQTERDSSRPRGEGRRGDSFMGERRTSPATWGDRPEGARQEGSRPPRPDRPERVPTAAEMDNQWRNNMRPAAAAQSPGQSRDGSEAPSSPAPAAAAPAPVGRPKLNLQKRTVSEAPGATSPPPASANDPKGNPFGAARPIDTAAKEREIAEKKEQLAKEKKEADEKAKEERRLAKEAAAKEAAEKAEKDAAAEAEAAEAESKAEEEKKTDEQPSETTETAEATETTKEGENESPDAQKVPVRVREQVQNPKSRANESGNWRSASGEGRSARGGYQNASRGGRGDSRGGRGGPRGGGRFEGGRPPRANGSGPAAAQQQATPAAPVSPSGEEAPSDPDGWTTVPSKGRRTQGRA